jgi:hypothetical protein
MKAMFRTDSDDRWQWSADVFPPLDFCVRVLRHDGLAVAPFDLHPDGDRCLRERGLEAETWRTWVAAVVSARAGIDVLSHASLGRGWPPSESDRAVLTEAAEAMRRPSLMCPGSPELRARVDELWADYEPEGDRWKRAMTLEQRRDHLPPDAQRWLWQALLPLHDRLATVSVFLVDYVQPVLMPVPPFACLIATDAADRDGWGYAQLVLEAAERLAGVQG